MLDRLAGGAVPLERVEAPEEFKLNPGQPALIILTTSGSSGCDLIVESPHFPAPTRVGDAALIGNGDPPSSTMARHLAAAG